MERTNPVYKGTIKGIAIYVDLTVEDGHPVALIPHGSTTWYPRKLVMSAGDYKDMKAGKFKEILARSTKELENNGSH